MVSHELEWSTFIAGVGCTTKFLTNGDLGGQTYYANTYFLFY